MLRSSEDTREIDAEDFFIDDGITVCESNEIIQSISVPREPFPVGRTGMAFVRLKRAAQKWPIVSAATAIRVDNPNVESPLIEEARIAIANASSILFGLRRLRIFSKGLDLHMTEYKKLLIR
jgi:carbon-monoxide dehydrogenase medium subunit